MTKVYYVINTKTQAILTYNALPWATPIPQLAEFVAWALGGPYKVQVFATITAPP